MNVRFLYQNDGVELILLLKKSLCSLLCPIINLAAKVGFKTKVWATIVV